MTDRFEEYIATLTKQQATPARRHLTGLVELAAAENITRHTLIERILDEGGSLRELSSARALKNGGLSVRFKGLVLVLYDGENYWDPKEIGPLGMRYALWLVQAGKVRAVSWDVPRIGRVACG